MSQVLPGAEPQASPPPGAGRTRVRARVVALGGALASTALVAAALVAAGAAPPATVRGTSAGLDVAVPATEVRLGCAGPPTSYAAPAGRQRRAGDEEGAVAPDAALRVLTVPSPAGTGPGSPPLVVTALADRAAPAADDPGGDPAEPSEPVAGAPLGGSGAALATAPGTEARAAVAGPVDGVQPLVAGSVTALAAEGDLRGLAASPCVAAADESWLVGGSTVVGDSTRLVLANPGTAPATVRTRVLTDAASAAGAGQLPVPDLALAPGEQRSVLLEAVAPGASGLAVQVRSDGGDVAAWLVTTSLRGLVPQGVEVVTPGEQPGTTAVVPGVAAQRGDAPPVLRLAAPGDVAVVARWEVFGPGGPVVPPGMPLAATVPAGEVVDVALPGVGPGEHTVVVSGDGPLAAAVQLRTSGDAKSAGDHTWTGAARPLEGPVLLTLPGLDGGSGGDDEDRGDDERDDDDRGGDRRDDRGDDRAAEDGDLDSGLVLHAPLPTSGPTAGGADSGAADQAVEPAPTSPRVGLSVLDASGELRPVPQGAVLGAGATVVLAVADLAEAAGADDPVALLLTAPPGAGVTAALRTAVDADGGARLLSAHALVAPPAAAGELRVRLRGAP